MSQDDAGFGLSLFDHLTGFSAIVSRVGQHVFNLTPIEFSEQIATVRTIAILAGAELHADQMPLRVDEEAVVLSRSTGIARLARQEVPDRIPSSIGDARGGEASRGVSEDTNSRQSEKNEKSQCSHALEGCKKSRPFCLIHPTFSRAVRAPLRRR